MYDPLVGNPHSMSNEVLNQIGIPSPKICRNCNNSCECGWKTDIEPRSVNYKEILLTEQEQRAKELFSDQQLSSTISETWQIFDLLANIAEETTSDECQTSY